MKSAENLKAICFTGAAWDHFIPAHKYATEKGIAITSAPGANSQAVAEYAVSLLHDRVRNISYLSGEGKNNRIRGKSFRDLKIGIIGAGNIGRKVGRILNRAYGCSIGYYSRSKKLDFEYETGAKYLDFNKLIEWADVLSFHVPKSNETKGIMNADLLNKIEGKIIINCTFGDVFDGEALVNAIEEGRISVASDDDITVGNVTLLERCLKVGSQHFIQSGSMTAYNADQTIRVASEIATDAMIAILSGQHHPNIVNLPIKQS